MENKSEIKKLYAKLESIEQRQEEFSIEIDALRAQLMALDPDGLQAAKIQQSKTVTVTRSVAPWPEQIDVLQIHGCVEDSMMAKTKAGTRYAVFTIEVNEVQFKAKIAETAKWVVETIGDVAIASGIINEDLSRLKVTNGAHNGLEYEGTDVVELLIQAADLNKWKLEPSFQSLASEPPLQRNKIRVRSGWEKVIGENIITLIGAVVVLMGVIFGVKYSIDHDLINPLTRIILGYALGAGLLFVGYKLKENYHNFSGVITSCAMAVMYFVTFAAYSFYGLLPQLLSFLMMTLFTGFTVFLATTYNRQVIAHLGLVGAYAVPFLLSNNSGDYLTFFSYITLINTGVLFLAFKKQWSVLYYLTFGFTWLIFGLWMAGTYVNNSAQYFGIALVFNILFFLMFYTMFLAQKLVKDGSVNYLDVSILLVNSMIFYGLGIVTLTNIEGGNDFLGLFTVGVGIIHLIASIIVYRLKKAESDLIKFVAGLVLVFLTIAIPVQLDGTWVTLLWGAEAVLIFWYGRSTKLIHNEFIAYGVMLVAVISMFMDWESAQHAISSGKDLVSFQYETFLTSLFLCASFGVIYFLSTRTGSGEEFNKRFPDFSKRLKYILPGAFLGIIYVTFFMEITVFWDTKYMLSQVRIEEGDYDYTARNSDLRMFKVVSLIQFSALFIGCKSLLNRSTFKSLSLAQFNVWGFAAVLIVFLTAGLLTFSDLRASFIHQPYGEYFIHGSANIWLRYLTIALTVGVGYLVRNEFKQHFTDDRLKKTAELVVYGSLLWLLCSELIHILNLSGVKNQYLLGISILCGVYSFVMVGIGINQKKQYLRFSAMILFGVVLLKLFLYDISFLSTIGKTIVFIVLGLLLLVISFMYNKYKNAISDEN